MRKYTEINHTVGSQLELPVLNQSKLITMTSFYSFIIKREPKQKKGGGGASASLEQRSSVLCSDTSVCVHVCVCLSVLEFVTQLFVRYMGYNRATCDCVCRCDPLHSTQGCRISSGSVHIEQKLGVNTVFFFNSYSSSDTEDNFLS